MHHSQTLRVGDETPNQNFSLQYDLFLLLRISRFILRLFY